jgi:hypothetical protein
MSLPKWTTWYCSGIGRECTLGSALGVPSPGWVRHATPKALARTARLRDHQTRRTATLGV